MSIGNREVLKSMLTSTIRNKEAKNNMITPKMVIVFLNKFAQGREEQEQEIIKAVVSMLEGDMAEEEEQPILPQG